MLRFLQGQNSLHLSPVVCAVIALCVHLCSSPARDQELGGHRRFQQGSVVSVASQFLANKVKTGWVRSVMTHALFATWQVASWSSPFLSRFVIDEARRITRLVVGWRDLVREWRVGLDAKLEAR